MAFVQPCELPVIKMPFQFDPSYWGHCPNFPPLPRKWTQLGPEPKKVVVFWKLLTSEQHGLH